MRPLLLHPVYFAALARKATLGADGLPITGGVLLPVPFPRRMYAGAAITFHDSIRVIDTLKRETEFSDVSLRSGGGHADLYDPDTPHFHASRSRDRGGK